MLSTQISGSQVKRLKPPKSLHFVFSYTQAWNNDNYQPNIVHLLYLFWEITVINCKVEQIVFVCLTFDTNVPSPRIYLCFLFLNYLRNAFPCFIRKAISLILKVNFNLNYILFNQCIWWTIFLLVPKLKSTSKGRLLCNVNNITNIYIVKRKSHNFR